MFVLIIRLQSQPYAVDAFLQMRPPFSPFLTELATRFPPALDLQLSLQDQQELNYPVQLRFSMQGEGVSIQTREDYTPPAIFLSYGIPKTLSALDLADYFQPEHLSIQGLDHSNFLQSGGRLPEGVYNICVEVLDQLRTQGAPISNQACAIVTLAELPPPIITHPTVDIPAAHPTSILFQWVPQHIGAFPVDYKLQLFEKREELSIAQTLSLSAPIFEINTAGATTFLYDADEPVLTEGNTYLLQVQIQAISGQHHFQHAGKSQVQSFVYGQTISSPCNLQTPSVYTHSVFRDGFECHWSSTQEDVQYEIECSTDSLFIQNRPNDQTLSVTTDTSFRFSDLSVNESYFYRVRAVVGECFSPYSPPIAVFTTEGCRSQAPALLAYSCGTEMEWESQAAVPLIQQLSKGDSIWANDFSIVLTEVRGQGAFTGKGYIEIPYFKAARVNVNFQRITVDQYCQLKGGMIDASGIGLALLDENQLALLSDLLAGLETAADILAASEAVLTGIDEIIATAEPYLADSILNNLLATQAQFEQTQSDYAAALAAGDDAAIATASATLAAAKAAMAGALEDYKEALAQFFDQLLQVLKALLHDLFQDCVMDQLSIAHTNASQTLDEFVLAENAMALNTLPVEPTFSSMPFQEYEIVIKEEGQAPENKPFDVLSNTYYEQEMSYLLCLTFQRLEEEIDTPAELQDLQALFDEVSASSFVLLGEAIKAGATTATIVTLVKQQMNKDLSQLIRQANYPGQFSPSN